MNLFAAFSRRAPNTIFVSIILGGLAGACYSFLIPLVLSVLRDADSRFDTVSAAPTRLFLLEISNAPFALVFTVVCLFILVARTASQVMLTRVAIDVASELRSTMYERIVGAPIPALESIGSSKLIAALTTDVPRIVMGARMLPDLLINMVTLVGMLGFLLVLNRDVFWFVIGCIVFGVITYQIPMFIGRRYFMRARRNIDELQESIRGLIHGVKELKLSDEKRRAYFETVLLRHEKEVQRDEKMGHTVVRTAMNYGDLLSFFVIGSIVFVFVNYRAVTNQELIGVVMALLYITGPVSIVLNFIPQIAIARVSLNRVTALFKQIPAEQLTTDRLPRRGWQSIRFDQVIYQHPDKGDGASFGVGPIDLEIRRGEITFIVGGNGSGKSTLSKLITLHYRPAAGSIRFGEECIDDENIGAYRESIGVIYSDYYLFDRVLGKDAVQLQETVDHYLAVLQLERKVTYRDGRFSTLSLSDGQRRRLALLIAVIEDKQLYLFDEWAADQDPTFKEVFYNEILPALRAKGKAVVAITHDDRYFHLADRIVVLEEGKVARIDTPSADHVVTRQERRGRAFSLVG